MGKDLETIARLEKMTPLEVAIEIERNGGAQVVHFGMAEEDIRLVMQQSWVATASDGNSMVPDKDSVPHPRNYGCFARKIGHYAVAEKLLTLEQAIRSASGLPADILRLTDRGYVKKDYFADIVVFDPKTYRDTATFDKPHQYATGVKYLFVNGVLAVDNEKFEGKLGGKVLRHQALKP